MNKVMSGLKQCAWTGDKGWRLPRTIGMGGVALGLLSLIGGAVQGQWNPIEFLKDSSVALTATFIAGGMISGYQILNCIKEIRNKAEAAESGRTKTQKFLYSDHGAYRTARTLAYSAALMGTAMLVYWLSLGSDTTTDVVKEFFNTHNIYLLTGVALSAAVMGSQLGNWIKSKNLGDSILDKMKHLVGCHDEESVLWRMARTLVVLSLGALTLALLNHFHGDGSMDPIQFMQDHESALIATIAVGSAFVGYQLGTSVREGYNKWEAGRAASAEDVDDEPIVDSGLVDGTPSVHDKAPTLLQRIKAKVIDQDEVEYRAVRMLVLAILAGAALSIASACTGGDGNPLDYLSNNSLGRNLIIGLGSAAVGYQLTHIVRRMINGWADFKADVRAWRLERASRAEPKAEPRTQIPADPRLGQPAQGGMITDETTPL